MEEVADGLCAATRKGEVRWTDFAKDLCDQLVEKNMIDEIEEFNKVKQEGSVTEYQERFEELRALMWSDQPALSEHYFVSGFINGLDDALRLSVKMFCPTTVEQAAKKARLQELALEAICRKHGLPPESYRKSSSQVCKGPYVAKGALTEKSGLELLNDSSKEADTEVVEGKNAIDEDLDQRKKQEAEGLHKTAAAEKPRDQERALETIFRKNELQPNRSTKSSQQIEGAYMAANQIEHKSEGNSELDQPIVTKKSSKEEGTSKAVGGNHSLYVQEVRDTPMKETSTEAEEGADARKMVEEFFVKRNKALAVLFNPLSVGELQHRIRFWPTMKLEFLSMIGNDMIAAITDQLEAFSMEIRMRGMAGLAVVASHSTNVFEENDTKRQKEKKTRDKHKKRRRRHQIARAGIG